MILIQEILVSETVIKEAFACNLSACKGACCVEGDYGAPLTNKEVVTLGQLLEDIFPYLPQKSREVIREQGFSKPQDEGDGVETELMADGACVFMGRDELGITFCGIEKAYNAGDIDFKKPVSCHLYPIRINKNKFTGFEAMNYDQWDICSPACDNGQQKGIKVFEFAKDAIIRKYGEEFYDELSAAAEHYQKTKM
jgi:Fe-S-cluster containining protein